jgi:hypothetical protein
MYVQRIEALLAKPPGIEQKPGRHSASPSRCISKWEWATSHNFPPFVLLSVQQPSNTSTQIHRRSKHTSSKANMDWPGTLETTDNNGLRIAVEGCVSNN